MESVKVTLRNVQSHKQTAFSIEPGFNIILAAGNNVGKSAIFKALRNIAEAPNNAKGLRTLLRYKCLQGYIAFEYSDTTVIYWMQRRASGVVVGFFEIKEADGTCNRVLKCPADLLAALGIELDDNGKVINFNDALAVQLLIQDSAENDAVISRVLVDKKVEEVKQGIIAIAQTSGRDYDRVRGQVDYYTKTLAEMSYNPAVEDFRKQESIIETFGMFLDAGVPEFTSCHDNIKADLGMLSAAFNVAKACQVSEAAKLPNIVCDALPAGLSLCKLFEQIDVKTLSRYGKVKLGEETQAIAFLRTLLSAIQSAQRVRDFNNQLSKLDKTERDLRAQLEASCQVVSCPVRGKVYFNNETCISYRERFTLEREEGEQV